MEREYKTRWQRILRNPVLLMVGGFGIAAVAAGLVIAFMILWAEPRRRPELMGRTAVEAEHFRLWYIEDSPALEGAEAFAAELEAQYADLVSEFEIDATKIPLPIDVFVHDDVGVLQEGILTRKSTLSEAVYLAPLDLLVDEDPRGRLGELVVTFGWGKCKSQVFQLGVRMILQEPDIDFHRAIAAAPDWVRLGVSDLLILEQKEKIRPSFYQMFDSPYSSASVMSLAAMKDLMSVEGAAGVVQYDIMELSAASLIQYLIETVGVARFGEIWGPGLTSALLATSGYPSSDDAQRAWAEAVADASADASAYWTAYFLLSTGDPDAAAALTDDWRLEEIDDLDRTLAGKAALLTGRTDRVDDVLAAFERDELRDYLAEFSVAVRAGEMAETARVRAFSTAGCTVGATDAALQAEATLDRIVEDLSLSEGDLPARVTVVVHPDRPSADRWEGFAPLDETIDAVVHVVEGDEDIGVRVASAVPAYAFGSDTASRLLREGLAMALANDDETLLAAGRDLIERKRWVQMRTVDFGTAADDVALVEGGLMMSHILKTCGHSGVREVWRQSSPLAPFRFLSQILDGVCGVTKEEIGRSILDRLWNSD